MISEKTYWPSHPESWEDVVAAFSPFDRATMADLPQSARDRATRACLLRIACLLSYHGREVPGRFVTDVRHGPIEKAGSLIAAYLDNGAIAGPRTGHELQQELLHFSRITDTEGIWHFSPRRLRNSRRLAGDIQTAIELAAVVRDRLTSWGIAAPEFRRGPPSRTREEGANVTIELPTYGLSLVVSGAKRRARLAFAFMFSQALAYLSPVEALWTLATVVALQPRSIGLQVLIAEGERTLFRWCHPGLASADLWDWVSAALPQTEAGTTGLPVTSARPFGTVALRRRALDLVRANVSVTITSLECGHIHLDRDLDEDQRFGLLVARDVCTLLAKRSGAAPQVIPLIDDEHVLVRTLPSVFGRFFERHFGRPPDRLVPESSPLLMAVGLRLLERLRADDPTSIRTRGTNQHLIDTDGTVIELLDLVSDSPSLGCVLFECALLLYRSDPGRFDAIGQKHCDDGESLHESVLSAIEARCPTDVHNRRRERLLAQSSFTNAIAEVVDNVIEGPRTNHLNVLEAYYSGQQRKVRSLIRRLGLPIGLQSLEFNRYTGTVVLNGA